jgi:hypothetical protein
MPVQSCAQKGERHLPLWQVSGLQQFTSQPTLQLAPEAPQAATQLEAMQ